MNQTTLQTLALNAAYERSLDGLLQLVARGVAQESRVALVQVWLTGPGDLCAACAMAEDCRDRSRCLHLEAIASTSLSGSTAMLPPAKETNPRIPIGVLEIGKTAETGEAMLLRNVEEESGWVRDPEWARQEGIRCFVTQPLVVRGEVIGVLAVYGRAVVTESSMQVLRGFTNHAAAAIANARSHSAVDSYRTRLEFENRYLQETLSKRAGDGPLIASAPAMHDVSAKIRRAASTESCVLIIGETGSGRGRIAAAIHELSDCRRRPLVTLDCSTTPETQLERELFGFAKGAFPGAVNNTPGLLEIAGEGNLFLRNVHALPLSMQPMVMAAVRDGEYSRAGETMRRKTRARVIASANHGLASACETGQFLRELYEAFATFPIEVPPLRERPEDIPLLAARFLADAFQKAGKPPLKLSPDQISGLQRHTWPGNVDELRHRIELAVMSSDGKSLVLEVPGLSNGTGQAQNTGDDAPFFTQAEFEVLERRNLAAALRKTGGKIAGKGGAAELLGVKPTTLASRIKVLGLK